MRSIKKDFFGNQVLTDISFTLREGEVLGLVGENGAGKSTLMKILFGMDVIRETGGYGGDVLINGEKVTFNTPFDALAAGIGMVHQEFSLIPGFTATENILLNREPQKKNVISEVFGSRLNTLDYKEMDRSAAAAIEKMGVHIDANMVISDMPVGHKQFTEIARELSKEHLKLLILDEPTAVLTEKEAAALLDSIRSMSARGIAVIFITHRLQEILDVCDKVIVMRDGHVVKDTPAKETNVSDITRWMVGRSVELSAAQDVVDHSGARTIMSIRKLWVDMPGEIVRNVDLDIREGEILGIGGLVGAQRTEVAASPVRASSASRTALWAFMRRAAPSSSMASPFRSTRPAAVSTRSLPLCRRTAAAWDCCSTSRWSGTLPSRPCRSTISFSRACLAAL